MDEKTISMERVYEGRIVSLELHEVEMRDGTRTSREIVRHGPAVAVVAQLPKPDDRFVFVRQFRKPLDRPVLEIVAGNVEDSEDLEEAACREVLEETGYEVTKIERLGALYPSPGYVDERIEIYYARLWHEPRSRNLDHDEDIEVHFHSRDVVRMLIHTGQIQDGKTMAAWLLYEQRRAAQKERDT